MVAWPTERRDSALRRTAARTVARAISPSAHSVTHPSGAAAYALRIVTGGKVIAYSGDTEWTDALIEAAQDAVVQAEDVPVVDYEVVEAWFERRCVPLSRNSPLAVLSLDV